MAKDDLTSVDVVNVLRGGVVEEPEFENGSWRYRARTQRIAVVIRFEESEDGIAEGIIVVTAWKDQRR
ncbi:hypothetical protein BH09MYX1_BH09MYX1_07610 [soil metagenome]